MISAIVGAVMSLGVAALDPASVLDTAEGDMSASAVTLRLKQVSQLRRPCLALGKATVVPSTSSREPKVLHYHRLLRARRCGVGFARRFVSFEQGVERDRGAVKVVEGAVFDRVDLLDNHHRLCWAFQGIAPAEPMAHDEVRTRNDVRLTTGDSTEALLIAGEGKG
jgi:hypothetical protein